MTTTTHPLALQREAERLRVIARLYERDQDERMATRARRLAREMERRASAQ